MNLLLQDWVMPMNPPVFLVFFGRWLLLLLPRCWFSLFLPFLLDLRGGKSLINLRVSCCYKLLRFSKVSFVVQSRPFALFYCIQVKGAPLIWPRLVTVLSKVLYEKVAFNLPPQGAVDSKVYGSFEGTFKTKLLILKGCIASTFLARLLASFIKLSNFDISALKF
jgi:hypothetical protein